MERNLLKYLTIVFISGKRKQVTIKIAPKLCAQFLNNTIYVHCRHTFFDLFQHAIQNKGHSFFYYANNNTVWDFKQNGINLNSFKINIYGIKIYQFNKQLRAITMCATQRERTKCDVSQLVCVSGIAQLKLKWVQIHVNNEIIFIENRCDYWTLKI